MYQIKSTFLLLCYEGLFALISLSDLNSMSFDVHGNLLYAYKGDDMMHSFPVGDKEECKKIIKSTFEVLEG